MYYPYFSPSQGVEIAENKKIAYLMDYQTIRILDLVSGIGVATINHETKVCGHRPRLRPFFCLSMANSINSFCSLPKWKPCNNPGSVTQVDWLELNPSTSKLLFRDRQRNLHLYDSHSQQRTTLLNYCSYVQWVPGSDVVVAQNRSGMSYFSRSLDSNILLRLSKT